MHCVSDLQLTEGIINTTKGAALLWGPTALVFKGGFGLCTSNAWVFHQCRD